MADYGKPQSGTAGLAASGLIDPVKPFKYAVQVFGRNADPLILYRQDKFPGVPFV
jgi:hypothetical protein